MQLQVQSSENRDLVGEDRDVGVEGPERLGHHLGGRLEAVAASQCEIVAANQVAEMLGIIVKLTNDEISSREQFALVIVSGRQVV